VFLAWCRWDVLTDLFQNLFMTGLLPDDVTVALRDSNQVAPLLPLVERKLDYANLAAAPA
jgi:hypothetical protein